MEQSTNSNLITNVKVYGLKDSIRAAKYPKAVDTSKLTDELTDGIMNLAKCAPGTGHNNWLTGVVVQFDLTCTNKMWVEFERYHFAQIISSQSTMHRITKFDPETQCCEYVDQRIKAVLNSLIDEYKREPTDENYLRVLYNVPSGFRLTARITTNYLQLKTMYNQRKRHRLPEWREYCRWVETLPGSDLITGGN